MVGFFLTELGIATSFDKAVGGDLSDAY